MKTVIGAVGATLLLLTLHTPAQALEWRVGANANFGTSNDFGVGPRVELDFKEYVPGLRLAGDYHKYFDSGAYHDVDGLTVESTAWDTGFHVLYDVATVDIAEGATIYAGAGMLYAKRTYERGLRSDAEKITDAELRSRYDKLQKLGETYKNDSGAGLALTVGSTFHTGWTVIPFVEARYTIGVVDELVVSAGILFSTGGAK